jgi:CRP-like cAMP-binding protein
MSTGSSSGKAATLAGLSAGGWFGEGSVLKGEARMYDIVALRDCRIASMNRATFMWLYENSVGFNRFLVRQMNERLGQFIALVEHERIFDATARIARTIAWLFNPVLNPVIGASLKISQEELGLLAGVSRQVTNRALKELEAEGLISQSSEGVTPINRAKLASYGD